MDGGWRITVGAYLKASCHSIRKGRHKPVPGPIQFSFRDVAILNRSIYIPKEGMSGGGASLRLSCGKHLAVNWTTATSISIKEENQMLMWLHSFGSEIQ